MNTGNLYSRSRRCFLIGRLAGPLLPVVLACVLAHPAQSHADTLLSCTGLPGGDFYDRGFYLPQYPGASLDSARLEFSSPNAGSYTVTLTVRSSAFNGPILGTSTVTFSLNGSATENKPVTFSFPDVAAAKNSLVCFTLALVSSPAGNLYYSVPGFSGGCTEVVQTEDTIPPLSTFRRDGVNLVITGRQFEVRDLVSCTNRVSGDLYNRGFYVPQYPGITLNSARLEFSASVAGVYEMTLTVRSNTYDGAVLGATTQKFPLNGTASENKPVIFLYPSIPIVKYSRICFVLSFVSGPGGSVFYSIPGFTGGCPDVVQTEGTVPPLDNFRRFGVNLVLSGEDNPGAGIHLEIARQPGSALLQWNSAAGQAYTLESTDTLPTFGPFQSGIAATPPTNSVVQAIPAGAGQRSYRVRLEPPVRP